MDATDFNRGVRVKKLSAKGQKWLKCLHIYVASIWVGCATVLTVMLFTVHAENGGELYGMLATLDFLDLKILVPVAIGTLLTGLVYSIWTNWGWFQHRWITVKWFICVFGIVFGTFWLGPWISEMAELAHTKGMQALTDPVYRGNHFNLKIFGTFQACTVIFAMVISTLKPWKKQAK